MRVLWLSPWVRAAARVYVENLQALGAEVMLVTSNLHPESDNARAYETVLLGRPDPTADWVNIAQAYRKARLFKPDVVVTEFLRDPRWRIFGGLAPRVRLVHDDKPHDATHTDPWWIRSFEPWNARADAAIVFSDYVAASMRARHATGAPIHVAPLTSDLDAYRVPTRVPAIERENFMMIGRQRPYKNHRVVFAAWEAHISGGAWEGDKLIILGDGEIEHPLPNQASWVRAPYRYTEMVCQLARAKGSIVHSRNASQSGVQVVSMQLAVPPIVSTAGALPEYQPPSLGVCGVDDVVGLSRAFDQLAAPSQVEIQSQIALDHYKHNYDAPLAAGRLLEIFDEVIGRHV